MAAYCRLPSLTSTPFQRDFTPLPSRGGSISSFLEFGHGQVTRFDRWVINNHDISRSLKSACPHGLPGPAAFGTQKPCEEDWAGQLDAGHVWLTCPSPSSTHVMKILAPE